MLISSLRFVENFLQGICVLGFVLHSTTGPQRKRPDLAHLLSLAHSSPWVLTHGRELHKDIPETSFCLPDPLPSICGETGVKRTDSLH